MFIIIPTDAHVSIVNLILTLLRRGSVLLHHPQRAHNLYQRKL